MKLRVIPALAAVAAACTMHAAVTINVNTAKKGTAIQPTMYGLFFEDINFAADGGLYAEMVKNRSFEFPNALDGWQSAGKVEVLADGPFERAPHYVRLSGAGHHEKHTALQNAGIFGMGVERDSTYRLSLWARTTAPGDTARLRVQLVDPASSRGRQKLAEASIKVTSPRWAKYTVELRPDQTLDHAALRIFLKKPDTAPVDLEHISLFPKHTFMGDENGLRADIATLLADTHPGIFRFPGGCIVEGTELPDRYQWKNTVGPVENRPLNLNRWQYTFPDRFYPDYYQSYGLGFYEYFRLAEQMGAEPLPVLNVGLVCQYQNSDPKAHVPVDALDEYVQDALDLVEFANGDTTTVWGTVRAQMGHPAPFNLKYIAIGNEQWGPEYVERLPVFLAAMRKAHPEIKVVGSSGPSPDGEQFDYLWPEMKRLGADLVDEHYYASAEWFAANAARYDKYDRRGPRVFAGEYACHPHGKKHNHFNAAVHEAAFMTGLERNADIVTMATYAPLLAHVEGWQWRPDMVWYDNLRVMPTSSYHVQKLYSDNKGTHVLRALDANGAPLTGAEGQCGLYASAVADNGGDIIVKVASLSAEPQELVINLENLSKNTAFAQVEVITLAGYEPDAENTLDNPTDIAPASEVHDVNISKQAPAYTYTVAPGSFAVLRFKK